jgi:hypothetical protein
MCLAQDQHPNVILSRDSQMGILKFPKFELSQLWGPITLCENPKLRWSLKQSCRPCRNLSNNMLHTTYMQANWGNSWLLLVGSQIAHFDSRPFFGHNLCFWYSNGSYQLILGIEVSRDFQWYKELFKLMNFDPCNCSLKIRESIEILTPKVGAHLGVWGFIPPHSPTLIPKSIQHPWKQ